MSPAGEKQWTVLAYMAGDNNLSAAALADLHEKPSRSGTTCARGVIWRPTPSAISVRRIRETPRCSRAFCAGG